MKVFVPMSDDLLDRPEGAGRLVPFNPDFMESKVRSGTRPANWISDSDYSSACRRLRESQRENEFA